MIDILQVIAVVMGGVLVAAILWAGKQLVSIKELLARIDERQQASDRRHSVTETKVDEIDRRVDEHHDRLSVMEARP